MLAPELIARQFQLQGALKRLAPLKVGNIHRTWRLTCENGPHQAHYVLQRINSRVFTQPRQLMATLERVCAHLQNYPLAGYQNLHLVPTVANEAFFRDSEGEYWRCYPYVENSRFFNSSTNLAIIEQAAHAFAGFLRQLRHFPQPLPPPAIPRFHDGCWRLEQLQQAIQADQAGRTATTSEEIEFFLERAELMQLPVRLFQSGELPQRLCHNDTKLNNILFDTSHARAVCVIDLDTVMPGTPLYDFGDLMRSCVSGIAEDSTDFGQAGIKLPIFEAGLRGYLNGCADMLNPRETELLPTSVSIMTLIIGSRFLTDYLEGDQYFRVDHPTHNLDRVHNQMALIQSLETHEKEMRSIWQRQITQRS